MVWVHWMLYNLPTGSGGLPEAVSALPVGALEGLNDWKRIGWRGSCPPIGRHRYFFKLYALDTVRADLDAPAKSGLENATKGHIIEKTELVGTNQR